MRGKISEEGNTEVERIEKREGECCKERKIKYGKEEMDVSNRIMRVERKRRKEISRKEHVWEEKAERTSVK